jgi:7-cyano-7-deazaguanine reductase
VIVPPAAGQARVPSAAGPVYLEERMGQRNLLEVFENPHPGRDYEIVHIAPEFTSVCPKTGQPDFGTVILRYVADRRCVELKSLKMYLQQYRQCGIFYEDVTNVLLDDLVAVLRPRWMRIVTKWNPRGGMRSIIRARHGRKPQVDG